MNFVATVVELVLTAITWMAMHVVIESECGPPIHSPKRRDLPRLARVEGLAILGVAGDPWEQANPWACTSSSCPNGGGDGCPDARGRGWSRVHIGGVLFDYSETWIPLEMAAVSSRGRAI